MVISSFRCKWGLNKVGSFSRTLAQKDGGGLIRDRNSKRWALNRASIVCASSCLKTHFKDR